MLPRLAVTAVAGVLLAAAATVLMLSWVPVDRASGAHEAVVAAAPTPVPSAFSTAVPEVVATPVPAPPVVPPVRISVADAGLDMAVVPVGVDASGALSLPADPATAGWYRLGPAPASPAGTTVIAAHVDAVGYGVGPFARLAHLTSGAAVTVTDTAGTTTRYTVASVALAPKAGIPWASVFDPTGPRRLVLVTCGGAFDSATRHYVDNLVVTATPA